MELLSSASHNNKGFTITELLIVIGIFAVLAALTTVNLLRPQYQANMDSVVYTLATDLNGQQQKAMAGSVDDTSSKTSYGVYFTQNSYTLFKGASYLANDSNNFVVSLPATFSFTSNTFTNSTVTFSTVSGEISGYTDLTNSIAVTNSATGSSKTLRLNRYGVVSIL